MLIRNSFFLTLWVLASIVACKPNNSTNGEQPDASNSPEAIVKKYQYYYDNNLFEEAKKLSTSREQKRLDELAQILAEDQNDATMFESSFLQLDCNVIKEQNRASCFCVIKDQYEEYEALYQLVLDQGQWLIDAPKDDSIMSPSELEEIGQEI